jgi:hypothetical protein
MYVAKRVNPLREKGTIIWDDGGSEGYEDLVNRHKQAPLVEVYILHIFLSCKGVLVKGMMNRAGHRFYLGCLFKVGHGQEKESESLADQRGLINNQQPQEIIAPRQQEKLTMDPVTDRRTLSESCWAAVHVGSRRNRLTISSNPFAPVIKNKSEA